MLWESVGVPDGSNKASSDGDDKASDGGSLVGVESSDSDDFSSTELDNDFLEVEDFVADMLLCLSLEPVSQESVGVSDDGNKASDEGTYIARDGSSLVGMESPDSDDFLIAELDNDCSEVDDFVTDGPPHVSLGPVSWESVGFPEGSKGGGTNAGDGESCKASNEDTLNQRLQSLQWHMISTLLGQVAS